MYLNIMNIKERNKLIIQDRKAGMTLKQLHAKYDVSVTQIARITAGIVIDRSSDFGKKDWILPRIESGMTAREMALEAGVKIGTMRYWIRNCQGKTKKRSQKVIIPNNIPDNWDTAEWFDEQYNVKHAGIPTISKLIGKSCGFVSDKLEEYGIKRRSLAESMAILRKRPSLEWLNRNYIENGMSVQSCAEKFGVSWDTMFQSLCDNNIYVRDSSEQHVGDLNSFYGKRHTPENVEKCRKIGAMYGKEYWTTGDVEAKKKLQSDISRSIWSDAEKRKKASETISELCKDGKCNPRSTPYVTNNGLLLLLRSSWEFAVAKWLDECDEVIEWKYEDLLLPYLINDDVKTFIVDFYVVWKSGLVSLIEVKNEHLLSQEKEQLKIDALTEYGLTNKYNVVVISDKKEIKKILNGYNNFANLHHKPLYDTTKDYLKSSALNIESLKHSIVRHVCPWQPPHYSDEELRKDIKRLKNENLGGYWNDGSLKSTAPNGGGMPGRLMMTHFNPHFWDVATSKSKPISQAFENKHNIYKCVNISISEEESLSFNRLLREISHHCSHFNRTSHFAPGFARSIIRLLNCSEKRVFDPCCGWGGRLIGSWLEDCEYVGCDVSPNTVNGLLQIAEYIDYDVNIANASCLEVDWPECDLVFTSPPFYDKEEYVGGNQPWKIFRSRKEWLDKFVGPFAHKCLNSGASVALYLDDLTMRDFENFVSFDEIVNVKNRRHSRQKMGTEPLCIIRK